MWASPNKDTLLLRQAHSDSNIRQLANFTELDKNRFVVHAFVGRGTFGEIYKAYDKLTMKNVAIKLCKSSQKYVSLAENESKMLSILLDSSPLASNYIGNSFRLKFYSSVSSPISTYQ